MSFKFNFDVEEDEDESLNIPQPVASGSTSKPVPSASTAQTKPCYHVDLEEMMDTLPPSISYSSIQVPGIAYPLLRRDLFDARFQLIDEEGSKDASGDAETGKQNGRGDRDYVDSNTDLIPGLYEGGLKTWEGGVDLVEVLSNVKGEGTQLQEGEGEIGSSGQGARVGDWARGGRVLELGCGTSLPSAFILRSIFSRPVSSHSTIIHLQDYNKPVLSLVSLPNLLLAALPFLPIEALYSPEDNVDVEDMVPDLEGPGSLAITDSVKRAFRDLLDRHKIELKFTYGDWSGLAEELGASGTHANGDGVSTNEYDLILTSETIYSEDSVDALLDVLRAASRRSERKTEVVQDTEIEERLGDLAVREKWDSVSLADTKETVVLVGAKVLYFGVGGDLQSFIQRVEVDGWSEPVKEWTMGVGRKVVRVGW